jgi:hypothetical protein
MFKVYVLVCSLVAPDNCIVGEDAVNLYPTFEECVERVNEINATFLATTPLWHVKLYRCEKQSTI